ncbi:MAG: PEGA domain-containing protein [Nitrospira sp.]|nr:MAG: PEGA domain-containing protein [Nitrospira sp.]
MQWLQIVKKVSFQLISLAVVACYLAGCSLFGPRSESIGVSSDPPGARVIASGKPVGTTPLHFEAQRGDNLLIEVQKSGYQTQYRTLSRKLGSLGILDVVGGAFFLLPLIGLFSSAAWEHDPAEIGIILEPEQKAAPAQ